MPGKRFGSGLGKRATTADGGNSAIRLNHVALTAQQESLLFVGHEQQSLQMPQKLVGAPVFSQFDGRPAHVPVILLQLRLKAAEERKSVGGRAGKSGQNLFLIQAANLLRRMLYHAAAERDLAVASHHDVAVAADA